MSTLWNKWKTRSQLLNEAACAAILNKTTLSSAALGFGKHRISMMIEDRIQFEQILVWREANPQVELATTEDFIRTVSNYEELLKSNPEQLRWPRYYDFICAFWFKHKTDAMMFKMTMSDDITLDYCELKRLSVGRH
jgi:hypothetical protein